MMNKIKVGNCIAIADRDRGYVGCKFLKFPSHVKRTQNKTAADKYIKVNGQSIYSGGLQRFSRAIVIENLHSILCEPLMLMKQVADLEGLSLREHAWRLNIVFGLHLGYGSVAMRNTKNGRIVGGGDDAITANYDLDNQWLWRKPFLDQAQHIGLLDSDVVTRISGLSEDWKKVPSFADRYLQFSFTRIANQ